jgi:hypothetical protein
MGPTRPLVRVSGVDELAAELSTPVRENESD